MKERKPEYCGHCGAAIGRKANWLTGFASGYGTVATFYAWFVFSVTAIGIWPQQPVGIAVALIPSAVVGLIVWYWDRVRRRHFLGAAWKEDWK